MYTRQSLSFLNIMNCDTNTTGYITSDWYPHCEEITTPAERERESLREGPIPKVHLSPIQLEIATAGHWPKMTNSNLLLLGHKKLHECR